MSNSQHGIIEGPALMGEVPPVTVAQFIRARARQRPDAVALVDAASGRSLTYGALDHLIGRFAAGLAAQGFKPGDTLLMFAPNSLEWPIAALGALAAGGVVSGANPMYNAADLGHQMRDAGARFVLTMPPFLATVREAAADAGCAKMIVLGEAEGTVSVASLLACHDAEPVVPLDPDRSQRYPSRRARPAWPKAWCSPTDHRLEHLPVQRGRPDRARARQCWPSCRCSTSSASPWSRCAALAAARSW